MALKEDFNPSLNFVEEINYYEIEKLEVVGKGSFGVVWKGRWRDRFVAVKVIESEAEKKAFTVEVRQLSRVSHPNIVKLYGACTSKPVCLVMEFAEGGSLYNVLHGRPHYKYNAGHAMSWALQCARGVAYLHGMKPKALIHRDLKPPNLLLVNGGLTLKICDFGTACDKNTYMTNNKGSAAWMAPEVFESSHYTEKCDVFSWGIILWEVLTRRKPFDTISGPAYAILWAVHRGQRPPLIDGCPEPIENLMTSCWDKDPSMRPAMEEVVRVMSHLFQFFSGSQDPITPAVDEEELMSESCDLDDDEEEGEGETLASQQTEFTATFPESSLTQVPSGFNGNFSQEFNQPLCIDVDENAWALPDDKENVIYDESGDMSEALNPHVNLTPSPNRPLVENSSENSPTPTPPKPHPFARLEALPPLPIRPSRLYPPPRPNIRQSNINNDQWEIGDEISPVEEEKPFQTPSQFSQPENSHYNIRGSCIGESSDDPKDDGPPSVDRGGDGDLDQVYLMLDPQLQPIQPDPDSSESLRVFEEHKKLAQEYLRVQTDIAYTSHYRAQLVEQLSEAGMEELGSSQDAQEAEEIRKLESEKASLVQLHMNLKRQLELIKRQRQPSPGSSSVPPGADHNWVVVPRS